MVNWYQFVPIFRAGNQNVLCVSVQIQKSQIKDRDFVHLIDGEKVRGIVLYRTDVLDKLL